MYIIHPHKMVYLANVRTGSSTLRRFLTDPENFKPGEVEIVSTGAPGQAHIWGEHHGLDESLLRQYDNRGYKITGVIRNPWDHVASWWHLGDFKRDHTLEDFIANLDEIVFYTLPERFPHTGQVLIHWIEHLVEFEGFVHHFESIFQGRLGWSHNSHREGHYRDLFSKKAQKKVARRYAVDIERGNYEF